MIVLDRTILDAPELGLELASAMWKLYRNDWDTTRLIELLGSDAILADLKAGKDARCIAAEYQPDLRNFMHIRQKYLIYGGS